MLCASTLIRAGVDVLTISRRLGHSSASMTLDVYGHLMKGADKAAAAAPHRDSSVRRGGREGKKALIAYFSPEVSKTLGRMAIAAAP